MNYNNFTDYIKNSYYIGVVIGSFANRIYNASIQNDNKTYLLERKDSINTNCEILNFMLTPGNVDDCEPLNQGKFMEELRENYVQIIYRTGFV